MLKAGTDPGFHFLPGTAGVGVLLVGVQARLEESFFLVGQRINAVQPAVSGKLVQLGLDFRAVFGARENVPIKPDPTGALEIAALIGLPPGEILYLGDTNTDMQTATAAGMFGVGAVWGFRTAAELLASGAKALADRPVDVLKFFGIRE